jgi:hypothetical protein
MDAGRAASGCWSRATGTPDPPGDSRGTVFLWNYRGVMTLAGCSIAGQWLMAKDALFDILGCLGYPMREWT